MWLWYVGIIVLLAWVVLGVRALPGLIRSTNLSGRDAESSSVHRSSTRGSSEGFHDGFPRVSIVLAARNEADALPRTLRSLRDQTYPNFEVIVVNDRSTDDTEQILTALGKDWPELRVIHITDLPDGWLGKNYALHTGFQAATGDWVLFTDADVAFAPTAVERAMLHALTQRLHHLTLAPRLVAKGFWLQSVVYLFLYNVVMVFRPQDADRPKSSAFVGIGAFNLIRRDVYENVGGHENVANRPDDDLALGHAIKSHGFCQKFAGGTELLQVEWYGNLREMAHGLEKNSMAPFQYQFWKFTLAVLLFLLVYSGPLLGTLFAPGWPRAVFAASFALLVFLFHMTRRYSGVSTWWALTLPLAAPILFFILVRSALLTAVRGGITWRGTFYALDDLRERTK